MKYRDLIRRVEQDGWYRIYKHPTKPGIVVIAYHGTKDVPDGTLKSILKQTGLE